MHWRGKKFILSSSFLSLVLLAILVSACAPSAMPTPAAEAPKLTEVVTTVEVEKEIATSAAAEPIESTQAPSTSEIRPLPTASPIAQATLAPTQAAPPATQGIQPLEEIRIVQVEWPDRMRLGDSDVIRLALVPEEEGYTLVTEFPEHQIFTQTLPIDRPGGYDLFAIARLDGVGFEISPTGEQVQYLPPAQPLGWRWTLRPRSAGQQRLSITLTLRWIPVTSQSGNVREITVYSRPLDIQVITFFGMTQNQALTTGFIGLFMGGGLSLVSFFLRPTNRKDLLRVVSPNPKLAIELPGRLKLSQQERALLQSIFGRYARLIIEQEFLSGYSGARAFLARPIRQDGRADAYTIAKLGEQDSIRDEFHNYESYVKDTLPPITARIQHTPVTTKASQQMGGIHLAALQYTFIGEPGSTPTSLRQALLNEPNPHLLRKLFDTFGPNWWLQRRPYTFRVAQEYDRLLPTHLVLEPAPGQRPIGTIDLRSSPADFKANVGDILSLRGITHVERRADGRSLSLAGVPAPGHPPLRLRWLSRERPEGAIGRVVATRQTLLNGFVQGCSLFGLPDPFEHLPSLLAESLSGSQSTIHGDLNLENILVGPGDMLWLIDFAQTRDGHTLQDFAHLYAELVAHILAPQYTNPENFLALLYDRQSSTHNPLHTLLAEVKDFASRSLFNPAQLREWHLSLGLTCLGALKFSNLSSHSRHLLYLTGAYQLSLVL